MTYTSKKQAITAAESDGFTRDTIKVVPAGPGQWDYELRDSVSAAPGGTPEVQPLVNAVHIPEGWDNVDSGLVVTGEEPDTSLALTAADGSADAVEFTDVDAGRAVADTLDGPVTALADDTMLAPVTPLAVPVDPDKVLAFTACEVDAFVAAAVAASLASAGLPAPAGLPGQCILQVHGAGGRELQTALAHEIAKAFKAGVTIRDAVSFAVIAEIAPGQRRASSAGQGAAESASERGPAECADGSWPSVIPDSNAHIKNLHERIDVAIGAIEPRNLAEKGIKADPIAYLESVRDMATNSTYYKQAKRRVAHWLPIVTARMAALDSEYGAAA